MTLSIRHALITGGGTGVGAAIAVALADAGIRVTVTGRRSGPLENLAAGHERMEVVTMDVTDPVSVEAGIADAVKRGGDIDVLVANAGAALAKPFQQTSSGDFRAMLDVNLNGVFNCWQAVLPAMKKTGSGRLIAIASTAGLKGYAYVSAYCAAKHGVIGLMRALAQELAATGITVNAVCPGYTETDLLDQALDNIVAKTGMSREEAAAQLKRGNPQNRFVQPEEVAEAVLWLCSDAARAVNGVALPIAGGEI